MKTKRIPIEELRSVSGRTLEELNYGNDITDDFVEDMENGIYEQYIS